MAIDDIEDSMVTKKPARKIAPTKATKRKRSEPAATVTAWQAGEVKELRSALLAWFDANHRVLPWRFIKDSKQTSVPQDQSLQALSPQDFAYRVWVSEVMLQQTQVATVVNYFNRWIAKWPTVVDLAAATQEEVNVVWAGLGYYRRAANLLKGAQHVVENMNGEFPATAKRLQEIPGVGPYTSAAVASIAFNEAVAAVDGNVHRVMARLLTIPGAPQERAFQTAVAQAATAALDSDRPGDWNQAVMELGATVCKPAKPQCSTCPVRAHCKALVEESSANAATSVTDWPKKAKAAEKAVQHVSVCVICVSEPRARSAAPREGCSAAGADQASAGESFYVLVKRPERDANKRSLLAGLWEMPSAPVTAACQQAARRAAVEARLSELLPESASMLLRSPATPCGSVVHIFSHIHMTLHVFRRNVSLSEAELKSLRDECERVSAGSSPVKLTPTTTIKDAGISTSVLKVLAATQNKLKFPV